MIILLKTLLLINMHVFDPWQSKFQSKYWVQYWVHSPVHGPVQVQSPGLVLSPLL